VNKTARDFAMALRARKVLGALEKRAPGLALIERLKTSREWAIYNEHLIKPEMPEKFETLSKTEQKPGD